MPALLSFLFACFSPFLCESLSIRTLPWDLVDVEHALKAAYGEHALDCPLDGVPSYVLNLDRRAADKLPSMQRVIHRDAPWMCSKTCRVSAPDGEAWRDQVNSRIMSDVDWQRVVNKSEGVAINGHQLTPGAVALIAGHGRMWEHAVRDKAPFAVIMEDDLAHFHPGLKALLCMISQFEALQEGWDFLMLQHNGGYDPHKKLTLKEEGHVWNTGMYIIKLDAARKALKGTFPITKLVQMDSKHSAFWSKLRGAHTVPAAADASHGITDVQQLGFTVESTTNTSTKVASGLPCKIIDCEPLDTANMLVPELVNPTKL